MRFFLGDLQLVAMNNRICWQYQVEDENSSGDLIYFFTYWFKFCANLPMPDCAQAQWTIAAPHNFLCAIATNHSDLATQKF